MGVLTIKLLSFTNLILTISFAFCYVLLISNNRVDTYLDNIADLIGLDDNRRVGNHTNKRCETLECVISNNILTQASTSSILYTPLNPPKLKHVILLNDEDNSLKVAVIVLASLSMASNYVLFALLLLTKPQSQLIF